MSPKSQGTLFNWLFIVVPVWVIVGQSMFFFGTNFEMLKGFWRPTVGVAFENKNWIALFALALVYVIRMKKKNIEVPISLRLWGWGFFFTFYSLPFAGLIYDIYHIYR